MSEETKCCICGCNDTRSLARVKGENMWFCNTDVGQGSHIIHYLRKSQNNEIEFHKDNPFHTIEFQCCKCKNTNIFDLGILIHNNQQYILCSSKCRFEHEYKDDMVYIPLVNNQRIEPQILAFHNELPPNVTLGNVSDQFRSILGSQKPKQEDLPSAKYSYDSPEQFVNIFTRLIDAESRANDYKMRTSSLTCHNVKWEGKRKFSVALSKKSEARVFKGVISVDVSKEKKQKGNYEIAFIKTNATARKLTISFFFRSDSKFYGADTLIITPRSNGVPAARQIDAVRDYFNHSLKFDDMKTLDHFRNLLLGKIDQGKYPTLNALPAIPLFQPPNIPKLNKSQKEAAEAALKQKFTFIQGPPGTGKTTTISAIVRSLVQAGQTPVLVVGHSNVTADFACKALADIGLKVGRVLSSVIEDGLTAAKFNDIQGEEFDYAIPGFSRSKYSTYQKALVELKEEHGEDFEPTNSTYNKIKKVEKKIIDSCQVICATSCTSGSVRMAREFKAVIFDEAGQCIDPDFIISLLHAPSRLILVGDTMQIGPTILSSKAKRAGLGVNLLKKLVKMNVKPSILTMQYRMHPSIAEFSSQAFYGGFINSGITKADRSYRFKKPFKWPSPDFPLLFWDIEGMEQFGSNGTGHLCMNQVYATGELIDELLKCGVRPENIGVISPYNAHNDYMIDNLGYICSTATDKDIENIEIATVDSFQGREKDFIILNLVRSNDNNEIGFLSDECRLNVSITRAKYGLLVIGNTKTFLKNALFCNWFSFFSQKGAFVTGKSFSELKPTTFTPPPPQKKDGEASAN